MWMDKRKIDILALQETHLKHSSTEGSKARTDTGERVRKYTWYFSSTIDPAAVKKRAMMTRAQLAASNPILGLEWAGVGIVLSPGAEKALRDVKPCGSRIMTATFHGPIPLTIISAYAPQAGRTTEEKDTFYQALDSAMEDNKHSATLILGDFNARLRACLDGEEAIMGRHVFGRQDWHPNANIAYGTQEHRDILTRFCWENG